MPSAILRADTFKTLIRIRIQRLRTESTQVKFLMDEAQQSHDSRELILSFGRTNDQIRRELGHLHDLSVHWSLQSSKRSVISTK